MSEKRPYLRSGRESWKSMLEAVPVRNRAARVDESEKEAVRISVKTKEPGYSWPLSWIVRPPKERTIILDRTGSRIWAWCDNVRTVEEVVDCFAEHYDLTFHEARAAVTNYLKMLVQRGALVIAVRDSEKTEAEESV